MPTVERPSDDNLILGIITFNILDVFSSFWLVPKKTVLKTWEKETQTVWFKN